MPYRTTHDANVRTECRCECYRTSDDPTSVHLDLADEMPERILLLKLDNKGRGTHLPVTFEPIQTAEAYNTQRDQLEMYETRICTNCMQKVPYRMFTANGVHSGHTSTASCCSNCGALFVQKV